MTQNLPAPIVKTLERVQSALAEVHEAAQSAGRQRALKRACAGLVFAYWQALFDHPRALLDKDREARILDRLKENGNDVGELLYCLDGAARDPWIRGTDPRAARPYDGIETILRDRSQVEKFAERRKPYRLGVPHPTAEKYLNDTKPQGELL